MTKIEQTKLWKILAGFNNEERNQAIFGNFKSRIEKDLNCKIERWPYIKLSDVTGEMSALSITDTFKNISELAVFIPNEN